MYLRFTVPKQHAGTVTRANLAPGPFRTASELYWDGDPETNPVLAAIRQELDWFNAELPVPKRFGVKARGRWWSDGVCWFRDSAREPIAHMEVMVSLLEDCGVPVTRNWTREPGQLLYRDDWQVVAKPDFVWAE
ncbi:MAG: hypothetical protein QNI87_06700 [Erythrobacter sp.]|uniref:hypothetical protein n=1 Tax=Erythrobacter sp. TaxID=1042 RepID=UPI002614A245|nr:hypothetical protein [Erythrobacter sp.]MDJ0978206.1 hypothetical protein [Erythrobacter sp.]